jgi:hypothetical protein
VQSRDARLLEEDIAIDIGADDLGVGEVIPPHAKRCAGPTGRPHVGGKCGVVSSQTALEDAPDVRAAMGEQPAVVGGVGVRPPRVGMVAFAQAALVGPVQIAEGRKEAVGIERECDVRLIVQGIGVRPRPNGIADHR